ncbi:MAG TPA: type II toxin-antitoxin system RelE/ParE family toxin [Alphaproteobacteria bacterium]|nr:type II toxin-antitoxin system RelE/ParE family toxin [Alphaproteobacteria bacterium]
MGRPYEVSFRPKTVDDLLGLYRYIAENSGPARAAASIDRIEAACLALANFPERGTRRDDIRPGLRLVGFECCATIAFAVRKIEVVAVPILYGGREYQRAFGGPTSD